MDNVQNLTNEEWSSGIERSFLPTVDAYNKKTYFNRYFFVCEKVLRCFNRTPGCKITGRLNLIDCSCGDGAGSAFLAEQFPNWDILGIDIYGPIIAYALKTYADKFSNLQYKAKSIVDIKEAPVDVFVCMETIEHIERDLMNRALERIAAELLKAGGKFIVSTPRLRPRESTVKRPGHINELYYQEFKLVLGEHFPILDFYSFDRYANIVPDTPDANCMIAVCTKWPSTNIF